MRYRLATTILFLWILGIFLGSFSISPLPRILWLILISSFGLFKHRPLFLCILIFLLGLSYSRMWRRSHFRSFESGKITITGKVISPPDIRSKTQYLRVKTNEPIAKSASEQSVTGIVLVKADRYLKVDYGDLIKASGKLEAPEPFEGFNYPLFLERDHVFTIMPMAQVFVLEHSTRWSLRASLSHVRMKLEDIVNTYIPEPESSFLSGLLFGSKRAIPSDVSDSLKATGTSHLVAISGANITFITAMALALLPFTNRTAQATTVLVVAGGLSLLTGGSASVVRGAVISSTNSFVRSLGRRAWPLSGILLAASIMLLFNPLLIRADPGFQLSLAAYAGLLAFSGLVTRIAEKIRLPAALAGSFTETGAASLGTAPLTLANGSFAARGLIVNPLVLWLIPPATALGFTLIAASPFPIIANLIAVPTWGILHIALTIIEVSSRP